MSHTIISGPPASGKTTLMEKIAATHTKGPVVKFIGQSSFVNANNVKWDGSLSSASLILVDEITDIATLLNLSKNFRKMIPAPSMLFCVQFPVSEDMAAAHDFNLIKLPKP